jgi:hypothetical protein
VTDGVSRTDFPGVSAMVRQQTCLQLGERPGLGFRHGFIVSLFHCFIVSLFHCFIVSLFDWAWAWASGAKAEMPSVSSLPPPETNALSRVSLAGLGPIGHWPLAIGHGTGVTIDSILAFPYPSWHQCPAAQPLRLGPPAAQGLLITGNRILLERVQGQERTGRHAQRRHRFTSTTSTPILPTSQKQEPGTRKPETRNQIGKSIAALRQISRAPAPPPRPESFPSWSWAAAPHIPCSPPPARLHGDRSAADIASFAYPLAGSVFVLHNGIPNLHGAVRSIANDCSVLHCDQTFTSLSRGLCTGWPGRGTEWR